MATIVMPDRNRSTVDELRKRIAELELPARPKMQELGRSADKTIDRLMGRRQQRAPQWPLIAGGIGLFAVIGVIAAYFLWLRRPAWDTSSDPWTVPTSLDTESLPGTNDLADATSTDRGLSAAESSLASNPYTEDA